MICLNCNNESAIKHPRFGWMPCLNCQNRTTIKPQKPQELTTDAIKSDRKEFKKDIVQPWRNGQLSKEYVDAVGTKYIKATPEEIKNAKPVWEHDYYSDS